MMAKNDNENFLAHIANDRRVQTVEEHLEGVAKRASQFADSFKASSYGYLAGVSHDIGKYSSGFQQRLRGGPKVDHASAGAIECAKVGKILTALCVAGHHGGLSDYGNDFSDLPGDDTFVGRIRKAYGSHMMASYSAWHGHLPQLQDEPGFNGDMFQVSLWTRMLYSSLVDADFLDTEEFMEGKNKREFEYDTLIGLLDKLNSFTRKWDAPNTELDRIRNTVREDCREMAKNKRGLFSLTVPTGGGKTVSSMVFALIHAITNGMNRIIYVIPYTSIIEQTAEVFRNIFGAENVLEHHSEAEFNYSEDLTEDQKKISLASENWDAPIIVTTAVQFFESLYANKPSRCRKLHNIANSVIIFDEAQMIPVNHLKPCMAVIGTLVNSFRASAVLCTATQPFVSDVLYQYSGDSRIQEICSDPKELFSRLERVRYQDIGTRTIQEIADELLKNDQVLCIVNTRKTAREIYELIEDDGKFHLSTLMCPDDRRKVLRIIRKRLSEGKKCRVVSTSLIEAGVDVDFPVVFRELSGLDSIVQAAGRCNREGRRTIAESIVSVFRLKDKKSPKMLRVNVGAAVEALTVKTELGSMESINRYFVSYRGLIGNTAIDQSHAVEYLTSGKTGCRLPFRQVADAFHLIEDNTRSVYILSEESRPYIDRIINGTADKTTYRSAGKFSVNIYENHFNEMLAAGSITELPSGAAVLNTPELYSRETGLSLNVESGKAEFI